MTSSLPEALQVIRTAVQEHARKAVSLPEPESVPWSCNNVPRVVQAHQGDSLWYGALSPGCEACKGGTWDCIFITMRCNLDCPFCISPYTADSTQPWSAFGHTKDMIANNYAKTNITGISFSGGEPFLVPDRLVDWLAWFKAQRPDIYIWCYTNGLLANSNVVTRMAQAGLDELRFNLAATGYTHPHVLEHVSEASRMIPRITVEIPAIPADEQAVMKALDSWVKAGVRILNLHTLIYEPGSNSGNYAGARQHVPTNDGNSTWIHPQSHMMISRLIEHIHTRGLPLSLNACTLRSKLFQRRARQRSLLPLTQRPYEVCDDNQHLISGCAYHGTHLLWFRPDQLQNIQPRYPAYRFVRVGRTAPVSMDDPGQWVLFEQTPSQQAP